MHYFYKFFTNVLLHQIDLDSPLFLSKQCTIVPRAPENINAYKDDIFVVYSTGNQAQDSCSEDINFSKTTGTRVCFRSCFATLDLPDKRKARWWNYTYYIICYPLRVFLCVSVPDCRERYFRRWFWITFINSCLWIGIYSYIMIWMITVIGELSAFYFLFFDSLNWFFFNLSMFVNQWSVGFTMGIPDSVMGLTFIAAGSSVPDAIASVLVVREG